MFVLGHVGFAVGLLFLLLYRKPEYKTKFDVRFLAIGAMMPDIIDKTIGLLIFGDDIDNGRIYSHTLLFAIILTVIAYYIGSRYTNALAFGSWVHIAGDRMWELPETFFWPAYRWGFPRIGFTPEYWLEHLLNDPYTYISEITGAAILLGLFIYFKLYKIDNWKSFWKSGEFP
jgi:hypothetical protein